MVHDQGLQESEGTENPYAFALRLRFFPPSVAVGACRWLVVRVDPYLPVVRSESAFVHVGLRFHPSGPVRVYPGFFRVRLQLILRLRNLIGAICEVGADLRVRPRQPLGAAPTGSWRFGGSIRPVPPVLSSLFSFRCSEFVLLLPHILPTTFYLLLPPRSPKSRILIQSSRLPLAPDGPGDEASVEQFGQQFGQKSAETWRISFGEFLRQAFGQT
jgi:hypothetical protein